MVKSVLFVSFLILLLTTCVLAADPLFEAPVNYSTVDSPNSMCTADFNGDGHLDLAVAGNIVHILFNNGDGTFTDAGNYEVEGSSHWYIVSGNFNGDGYADLAMMAGLQAAVMLNLGDGTFADPVLYPAGSWPKTIAAVDLDNDGYDDLAVVNRDTYHTTLLQNQGDGTFAFLSELANGCGNIWWVATADFDGDGWDDLATAAIDEDWFPYPFPTLESCVNIHLNDGDGTFTTRDYSTGLLGELVFPGDLDSDGDCDVVIGYDGSGFSVLFNNGSGALSGFTKYTVAGTAKSFGVADFDLDGLNDLTATMGGANSVGVLLNTGGGIFGTPAYYPVGLVPNSVVTADFDGDGDIDLAVANQGSDDISVLMNRSIICCESRGDVDHNGSLDLLDLQYLNGYLHREGPEPPCLDEADVNGDGVIDTDDVSCLATFLFSKGDRCQPAECE